MKRKYLTFALVALLLQSFVGIPATAAASVAVKEKTQAERDAQTLEQVKVKVARLGVGERARDREVQRRDETEGLHLAGQRGGVHHT